MENKKSIIVVEDEAPIAKALKIKLEREGFEVDVASNGEEGVQMIESDKYELALLDLVMPKLDGFGVLEYVKENGIKTKIIVTTNLGQEEDAERALELGAEECLVKSDTSINDIVDKVKEKLS